mmetsp:Transcript_4852/g.16758  ORF Transcript_4852/g.16758 Transcript_4852/m.16758 type:complete len:366 (-) Transcript_4852:118-1215(-)
MSSISGEQRNLGMNMSSVLRDDDRYCLFLHPCLSRLTSCAYDASSADALCVRWSRSFPPCTSFSRRVAEATSSFPSVANSPGVPKTSPFSRCVTSAAFPATSRASTGVPSAIASRMTLHSPSLMDELRTASASRIASRRCACGRAACRRIAPLGEAAASATAAVVSGSNGGPTSTRWMRSSSSCQASTASRRNRGSLTALHPAGRRSIMSESPRFSARRSENEPLSLPGTATACGTRITLMAFSSCFLPSPAASALSHSSAPWRSGSLNATTAAALRIACSITVRFSGSFESRCTSVPPRMTAVRTCSGNASIERPALRAWIPTTASTRSASTTERRRSPSVASTSSVSTTQPMRASSLRNRSAV